MKSTLKLVVMPYAGVVPVTQKLLRKHGLLAGNLHHNCIATAEMAISLLFNVAKHGVASHNTLKNGDWSVRGNWEFQGLPQVILDGGKMVVIGYGHLGRNVCKLGLGLGMKVTALRRSLPGGTPYVDKQIRVCSVSSLMQEILDATAVMVCCPGTKETKGMINDRVFAAMPKTSILVNVARGSVVDQEALYNALKTKSIFGAGVDTWYNYPKTAEERKNCPPGDLPFGTLKNIVMSPHNGGAAGSERVEKDRIRALAHGLNCVSEGKDWPTYFDLNKGY